MVSKEDITAELAAVCVYPTTLGHFMRQHASLLT